MIPPNTMHRHGAAPDRLFSHLAMSETDEAPSHPHNAARRTYVEIDGVVQPAPVPRFSRTAPELPTPPQAPSRGEDALATLALWLDPAEIAALRAAGTLG